MRSVELPRLRRLLPPVVLLASAFVGPAAAAASGTAQSGTAQSGTAPSVVAPSRIATPVGASSVGASSVGAGPGVRGTSGTGTDTPADPEDVRDEVREVMDRPEFSYEKSWLERLGDWLGEQLDKLFPEVEGGTAPGGTFGGGIGPVLAYVMIVVALAAVIGSVVYVVLRRVRTTPGEDDEPTETEIEHRRGASQWRSEAQALEDAGEWKDAIRARYRLLVRTLTDRQQLPDIAGRTTGELRQDLAVSTPDATEAFDTASLLFELPWYADLPTGPDENTRFRAAADAVLAARMVDRFDGLVPLSVRDASGDEMVEVRA